MSQASLKDQYADGASRFERLRVSVLTQISELLESNDLVLGVPIESRVKAWVSIEEKMERKAVELKDIRDLQDLIGIRMILLFRNDLEAAIHLIGQTFDVISSEDAGKRLGDSEFGYQSQHIIVKIPKAWLLIPSFASLDDLCVELQIRTLAQHIWAAASHKLQYKNEESVPPPIRRAINRASALLETVDLEFDRVLEARRLYVGSSPEESDPDAPLNVDTLALVLSGEFSEASKKQTEDYANLLHNLTELNISTAKQLRTILRRHKEYILKVDAKEVAERRSKPMPKDAERRGRIEKGVFFSHVGLARTALRKEFGSAMISKLIEQSVKRKETVKRSGPRPQRS